MKSKHNRLYTRVSQALHWLVSGRGKQDYNTNKRHNKHGTRQLDANQLLEKKYN